MQIEIQARHFPVTQALRRHIERRVGMALGSCCRHVKRILVRLSDINGPRGGHDKRCQLEVLLPGGAVVVADTRDDLYVAINRAAARAGHAAVRRIGRKRNISRLRAAVVAVRPEGSA